MQFCLLPCEPVHDRSFIMVAILHPTYRFQDILISGGYSWLEHRRRVGCGGRQRLPPFLAILQLDFSIILLKKQCFGSNMHELPAFQIDFEPRNANGSKYNLHIMKDIHGGWLVVWGKVCTWRYYSPRYCHSSQGELKLLTGTHYPVDTLAVREYLDGVGFLA